MYKSLSILLILLFSLLLTGKDIIAFSKVNNYQVTTSASVSIEDQIHNSQPKYQPNEERAKKRFDELSDIIENIVVAANKIEKKDLADEILSVNNIISTNQDTANKTLDNVNNRNKLLKLVIGPGKYNMKVLDLVVKANDVSTYSLEQLIYELDNTELKQNLETQIGGIKKVNSDLSEQYQVIRDSFSLLGWTYK